MNGPEEKKYPLPEELRLLNREMNALIELRDKYVSSRFSSYKKAKKAALDAAKLKEEFWKKVKELYPETALGTMVSDGVYVWRLQK